MDDILYYSGVNANGIYVLENQMEIHNLNTKRLKITLSHLTCGIAAWAI